MVATSTPPTSYEDILEHAAFTIAQLQAMSDAELAQVLIDCANMNEADPNLQDRQLNLLLLKTLFSNNTEQLTPYYIEPAIYLDADIAPTVAQVNADDSYSGVTAFEEGRQVKVLIPNGSNATEGTLVVWEALVGSGGLLTEVQRRTAGEGEKTTFVDLKPANNAGSTGDQFIARKTSIVAGLVWEQQSDGTMVLESQEYLPLLPAEPTGTALADIRANLVAPDIFRFKTSEGEFYISTTHVVQTAAYSGSGSLTNDSVTNMILANMPAKTIKGNATNATADPQDLTIVELKDIIFPDAYPLSVGTFLNRNTLVRNGKTIRFDTFDFTTLPDHRTLKYLHWVEARRAKAIHDAAGWHADPDVVHFYISPTGSDANDGLTPATPWQTAARVQTAIDAKTDTDKHIYLFQCGGTWTETAVNPSSFNPTNNNSLILVNKNFTGFGQYGDLGLGRPVFNRFNRSLTSGWTDNGDGTWSQAVNGSPRWIAEAGNYDVFFAQANDAANVVSWDFREANGSFFHDGSTLTIRLASGTDPNTLTIDIVDDNRDCCFELSADQCFVDSIIGYGWGINQNGVNTDSQCHTVQCTADTGTSNWAGNVKAYYSGSHALAQLRATGIGGSMVYTDCDAGGCMYNNSSGETVYNFYGQNGLDYCGMDNCKARGTLPDQVWYGANRQLRSNAIFTHTAGANGIQGAFFSNCYCLNEPFSCAIPGSTNDIRNDGSNITVRGAIVGFHYENTRPGARLNTVHGGSCHRIANYIRGKLSGSEAFQAWTAFAHTQLYPEALLNVFDFDDSAYANGATVSMVNANNTQEVRSSWYNNLFVFRCGIDSARNYGIPSRDDALTSPITLYNNIFAFIGPATTDLGNHRMPTDGSQADNNAYYTSTTFATDTRLGETTQITLTDDTFLDPANVPTFLDSIFGTGRDVGLEYNRHFKPVSKFTPNIGPN